MSVWSNQLVKKVNRYEKFLEIPLDKMRMLLLFLADFPHFESYVVLWLWEFILFQYIWTPFPFSLQSLQFTIHLKSFRGFLYLFDDLIGSGKVKFQGVFGLIFWRNDLLSEVGDLAKYFVGLHVWDLLWFEIKIWDIFELK